MRTAGYQDAIAIVSQPLRRGHSFRFRVDKLDAQWAGSAAVGAVAALPTDGLPRVAVHLEPAAWVLSSELLYDGTCQVRSPMALDLENVNEQSVLTLHFRFNSDLMVDLDGRVLGIIGSVSRLHSHVYPLIDLYGKVCQVSVLLHPYSIISGTSLDLPIIAENRREETLAELEQEQENQNTADARVQRRSRALSQDILIEDFELSPPGSSADVHNAPDNDAGPEAAQGRAMHRSLTLGPADSRPEYRVVQKSHSTHNFTSPSEFGSETRRARNELCDTNIQHNDRYPEASDVDNLDNEIMDALTLETGNLPDLTEDQSSSLDESTRRDDAFEPLSVENLNYLNRILGLDQEGEGSLEAEWEASGEGCEHLHLVLKYWNFLVLPYPELRQAVSWGQVKCYCSSCVPDAEPLFAGWVRIERIDGVGAATRGFWHIARSTLGAAQAVEQAAVRRPAKLSPTLVVTPSDVWMDEEGKPHHTVLAIEIDIEGNEAEKDRLLAFLIYMKPHIMFVEDSQSSLDE